MVKMVSIMKVTYCKLKCSSPTVSNLSPATLKETVSSLKGYEATLEGQEKHISELVEEREMYYNLNQELEEKIKDLELKLNRATNSKESLDQKVVQLSEQLEGQYMYMEITLHLSISTHICTMVMV